jgi:transcription initiation factor TFIIB
MNERKALNNNTIVQNDVDSPLLAEKIQKCPECGSKNIITDPEHAELYCADCGRVIREKIVDTGPEWHVYDPEQIGRIRAEPTIGEKLGTPYAGSIPGLKKRWGIQIGNVAPPNQENISVAFKEINRICMGLNLPKTVEQEARDICKSAQKENLLKGAGGIYRAVAAIVLIACRRQEIPIFIEDISKMSHNEKATKILEKSKTIKKRLGLSTFRPNNSDPITWLPKFCSELKSNKKQVENLAKEIIRIAKEQNLTNGRRPNNIAAAAVCIAEAKIGNNGEMSQISEISKATDQTIKKRIREFIKNESIVSFLDKM